MGLGCEKLVLLRGFSGGKNPHLDMHNYLQWFMRPGFRVEEIYTYNVDVRMKIKILLEKN